MPRGSHAHRPAPTPAAGPPPAAMAADDGVGCSVLFPRGSRPEEPRAAPDCFVDLHLDQIVGAITAGREAYRLAPFFWMPLGEAEHVRWRQDVMRDVATPGVLDAIRTFARAMDATRHCLTQAGTLHHALQQQRWFLEAVRTYCDAVTTFADALSAARPSSAGLSAVRDHLTRYAASPAFTDLAARARGLDAELATIRYRFLLHGLDVQVERADDAPDYSAEIEAAFRKFAEDAPKRYPFTFVDHAEVNAVEGKILDGVARLFPEVFRDLAMFRDANAAFPDATLVAFDREVQVYVAVLEHVRALERAGLPFCFPVVVTGSKAVVSADGFDLALAQKLVAAGKPIVCNDFQLAGPERIIVVSGPNQGGKTTFARTFGQLHYLASLGFPVPGTRAELVLCDRLLTHFERAETAATQRGKLQDDLLRLRDILERATPDSVVILNEIFTSTTLEDAVRLSRRIAEAIVRRDVLCVWVTFIEELASLGPSTVSMVSTVVPDDPAVRTFKIVRAPANGLAYALSIAERHGLTRAAIRRRLAGRS
jgi:DNA mismatch repair protein MutS